MADQAKKPGVFARISRSLRDTRGEFKKIVWPTKQQVLNNTGIVIAFMVLAAVLISAYDGIISLVFSLVLQLSS